MQDNNKDTDANEHRQISRQKTASLQFTMDNILEEIHNYFPDV